MRTLSPSLLAFSALLLATTATPAFAETQEEMLKSLIKRVDEQQRLIQDQQRTLNAQSKEIRTQSEQLKTLQGTKKQAQKKEETAPSAPAAAAPTTASAAPARAAEPQTAAAPVTKIARPAAEEQRPQVAALADQGGILTPAGHLTYENALEYTNTTRNLFSFNGVQLAQVVLVGALNNNTTRHQVAQYSGRLRVGLTNRMEADIHAPFVYRNDAITETNTSTSATTKSSLEGANLGDIDAGVSYQLNDGTGGLPFFIGNLRYKANNADGPFDVGYDSNNVAKNLPTGTGFQTVEASVTAIKVSDPAVLFGNLGYVYDVARDIDRDFGNTRIKDVSPGDAINASFGVGFAMNQDLSLSLGYKHSYVFPTVQHSMDISSGTTYENRSDASQVGAVVFGLNNTISPTVSLNSTVEAGVTNDAPDVRLMVRLPIQLGKVF